MADRQDDGRGLEGRGPGVNAGVSAGVTGGEQGHHSTGGRNVIGPVAGRAGAADGGAPGAAPADARQAAPDWGGQGGRGADSAGAGAAEAGLTALGLAAIGQAGAGQRGPDIFFAAVQMSRMPMCLTDPKQPDDPIVFCNQAFEQLTGYSQAEIIGRNCRFLQGEKTDPAMVAEIRRVLAGREDVHLELLNYRRDGSSFWNALFISPVFDTSGELVYYFASQLDVTRRREAEAVLQQSQRLETLGSMASSLAHEFNNLMTIVLANLERLEREPSVDQERVADPEDGPGAGARPDGEARPGGSVDGRRQRQIERAKWGAQRAARLTDQMLSFARRQFHDDRVQDVGATLAACDTILDQMAGSGIRVRLDLEPGRLMANLDASRFEMAVLNLVRNAADASPKGGEVVISTRRRGSEVEVSVADTGRGMSAEVAQRATEPFFTTKEVGSGTGLGLSMVKGFVEQSHGRLSLDTSDGVGTTVRLLFPLVG